MAGEKWVSSETWRLGAVQAWRAIQTGDLTVRRYVDALLDRIDEREGIVKAWAHVAAASARHHADAADRHPSRALLHGVPVGVKDVIDVAGMPTRGGAPELYTDVPVADDAPLVSHLRTHGSILLGKTASARYGMMIPGPTRNPHDTSRSPGASSSGSAAAVADGMVPVAVGTQTAGSILRPAAYCGVVGYKPTFGSVSAGGTLPLSSPLDTTGCIARSVGDASLLFAAMTDDPENFISAPREDRLRVGVFRGPDRALLAPDVAAQFEQAIAVISRDGHRVTDLQVNDDDFTRLGELQDLLARHDTRRRFAEHGFGADSILHRDLIDYCEAARGIDRVHYESAIAETADLRRAVSRALSSVDVVVTPATLTDAPPVSTTGTSELLRAWTLLGNPSISLPFGRSTAGMPLAIQLVGHPGQDRAILAIAMRIEQLFARAWA